MGLRYRKTIGIGGGARINLSKSGIGISTGVKGLRVGTGPRGGRITASIPGTGLSYTKQFGTGEISSASTSACSYCAETIKTAAIVCRYCQRDLGDSHVPGGRRLAATPGIPPPRNETAYFDSDGVLVTSARAVMAGKTYAIANVTSVAKVQLPGTKQVTVSGPAVTSAVASGVWCFVALFVYGSVPWASLGGIAFLVSVAVGQSGTTALTYAVRIVSASGEADVLVSHDEAIIQAVTDAITSAIVQRR